MSNGHSAEAIEATSDYDFSDDLRGPDWREAQEPLEHEQWHKIQQRDEKEMDKDQLSINLKRPFDPKDVKSRSGGKGKTFHYIDARHVMKRLDDVFGIANWQTKYTETPSGRVLCELSVRINNEWITKSDGAGDTDFEGAKGAISDALKRSAVLLGIGAYLYNDSAFRNGQPAIWATPEGYDKIIASRSNAED